GARVWSDGGGRGGFGEANAALTLGERAVLVVAGGRYPTDPIRGSIAGRYASVAVRLRTALFRSLAARDPRGPRTLEAHGAPTPPAGPSASRLMLHCHPTRAANHGKR